MCMAVTHYHERKLLRDMNVSEKSEFRESVEDDELFGRSQTSCTDENIETVHAVVLIHNPSEHQQRGNHPNLHASINSSHAHYKRKAMLEVLFDIQGIALLEFITKKAL
ncbi:hypothetical protein TNCV_2220291 [Trichonephila clavipes]|nr:hypothetical protein TNCV_2220291 [Trichonephila clavipes]